MVLVAAALVFGACEGERGVPNRVTALTAESHPRFPIDAGAVHAGVDCNSCHGAFDTFAEFDCLGCHEHRRDIIDPVHLGMSGYAYDSHACYECHPDGTADGAVSRENHTAFPVAEGSLHATVACTSCHVQASDLRVVDCATCHAGLSSLATEHSRVRGYVAGRSDLCLRCHPSADVPITVAAHDSARFRLSGEHSECLACHDGLLASKPFPAADFGEFSCYGTCHKHSQSKMDDTHSDESGYAYDFARCVECHPNGTKP